MPVARAREPGVILPYILPGTVGFLGDEGALTSQTSGSSTISVGPGNYDGIYFRKMVLISTPGTYLFQNCIFEGTAAAYGIFANSTGIGSSPVTFEDCSFRWKAGDAFDTGGSGAIQGSALILTARRCDLSGKADGISLGGTTVIVEDCYIHDLVMTGAPPNNTHNDGLQFFGGSITTTGCYFKTGALLPFSNACMFFQGVFIVDVVTEGNYFSGGGYSYYAQHGSHTVRNNTFNTDNSSSDPLEKGHLYNTHLIQSPATVVEWSGNITHAGTPVTL